MQYHAVLLRTSMWCEERGFPRFEKGSSVTVHFPFSIRTIKMQTLTNSEMKVLRVNINAAFEGELLASVPQRWWPTHAHESVHSVRAQASQLFHQVWASDLKGQRRLLTNGVLLGAKK